MMQPAQDHSFNDTKSVLRTILGVHFINFNDLINCKAEVQLYNPVEKSSVDLSKTGCQSNTFDKKFQLITASKN